MLIGILIFTQQTFINVLCALCQAPGIWRIKDCQPPRSSLSGEKDRNCLSPGCSWKLIAVIWHLFSGLSQKHLAACNTHHTYTHHTHTTYTTHIDTTHTHIRTSLRPSHTFYSLFKDGNMAAVSSLELRLVRGASLVLLIKSGWAGLGFSWWSACLMCLKPWIG